MTDITILNKKDGGEDEKGLDFVLKEERIQDEAKKARDYFAHLQSEAPIKDGLSYLDMKNDILLSYMIDLCNIVLRKVRGQSITGHKSVERCVTYRVILEKIKAIDQKLEYQLKKLISLPEGADVENHAINLENLDIDVGSESEDDYEQHDGEKTSKKKNRLSDNDDDDDEDDDEEFDGSGNDEDEDVDEFQTEGKDKDNEMSKKRIPKSSVGVYKAPKLRSVAYERRKNHNDFYQDEGFEVVDITRTREDEKKLQYEEENYTRVRGDSVKRPKKVSKGKKRKKYRSR